MIERICPECGKPFLTDRWRIRLGRAKHCSKACASNARRGTKHPLWKGGSTKPSVKNWRKKNPAKYRAQNSLRVAVHEGRITKLPCAICGTTKNVHGHHDNYDKPLEVVWLCHKHHMERHRV